MALVPSAHRDRRIVFGASLVLVVAAAAGWWGSFLTQGAPFVYHPDEPSVMSRALKIVDTGNYNPGWFHYPSFVIYLQVAVANAVHWLREVPLKPGATLMEGAPVSALPYYFAGRGLTLSFALGTTVLTMLITRRLAGVWPALLAGVIFASSTLAQRSAIYVTVDMPLTFFTSLSVFLLMRTFEDPASRRAIGGFALAAISGSLAGSAKYNGALILFVLPFVLLLRRGFSVRSFLELAALAVLCVGIFVALTPYSVLDSDTFWDRELGLTSVFIHYGTKHLGADVGPSGPKAFGTVLNTVGPFALLSVLALPYACTRALPNPRRAQTWLVMGCVVVLALPVVIAKVYFERNCLPFVPLLIALACLALSALVRSATLLVRNAPARQITVSALVVLPLVFQGKATWDATRSELIAKSYEDTRTTAYGWALENLPRGARIFREAFTPQLHFADRFIVGSCFAVGEAPVATVDSYDYLVTTSVLWSAYPDLTKTTYGHFFSRPALYELPSVHGYPALRIDRVFRPHEPTDLGAWTVFRLSREDGFADLEVLHDAVLALPEPGHAGPLEVDATGSDPSLLLPALPALGPRRFLLRVALRSPKRTTLQVFYRARGAQHYDEEHSVRAALFPGENQVDLRFGPAELKGRLRLDPAERPSLYTVEDVVLYAWPAETE